MTIQEAAGIFDIRVDSTPRAPGAHVSEILKDIALKLGVFKPQDEEEDLDLMLLRLGKFQRGDSGRLVRIALGLAWEEWMSRQIPGLIYHPGEMTRDGVSGNPDGVVWHEDLALDAHEIKVTWRSSRTPVVEWWYAVNQLRSYCRMLETLIGWLHVCHVMGDYRGSGPQYIIYRFEFTQEELEATWRMIVNHRDRTAAAKAVRLSR